MTTTQAVYPKAETGRRILFTHFRDLPNGPEYPGVITDVDPDPNMPLGVRLDGTRSTLHVRPNYEGLRYLDEVGPVPELPMGRFIPEADDRNGFFEQNGVVWAAVGEDGEELVVVTDSLAKARAAAFAYAEQTDLDLDFLGVEELQAKWAVFEWEPQDAESKWRVRWDVAEGDDQAVHIFYLPAA